MTNALRGGLMVGQSGGPTAVINSSLVGVAHEAGRHPEITRVLGMRHGIEGLLRGELVDLGRQSPRTLDLLRRTPAAGLGSGRYRLRDGDVERALGALIALDIRHFLYIGGNDSADTAHRIGAAASNAGYDLRCVVVPKTIDNDLPFTDHCPGFGSIARFVALATRDAGLDTESMRRTDPVKLVEVMGRNAGWVAGAAALAKRCDLDAPHLIYPPERPLSVAKLLDDVQRVYDRLGFVVAVVTETVRDERGQALGVAAEELGRTDAFGHPRLVGAASYLCREIAAKLGLKARWDKPGTIARMSIVCASEVDLEEAYLVGQRAVQATIDGETDRMVTILRDPGEPYRVTTGLAPLAEVAGRERRLPWEYLTPEGSFVTPAFLDYARPLIGGALPEYARLESLVSPA